jgi:branched-subunit amino acid aminotransferase/4-amino-4-deoxychorismate lyase
MVHAYAVTANGLARLPVPPSSTGVHDVFDDMPLGIYSGLRSFEGNRFLHLDDHFARCERNLEALGWDVRLDRDIMRRALAEATNAFEGDVRLRFDVLEHAIEVSTASAIVLLAVAPFVPVPLEIVTHGARLAVERNLLRDQPRIKTTDWVVRRRACSERDPAAYEHLLVDGDGRVLECTSSNFFGVRDGVVLTAGAGVLEGITRSIVLRLAAERGIEVCLDDFSVDDIPSLEEAFLTSSTRSIVPVTQVGDHTIGGGAPGPLTLALSTAYSDYAARRALRVIGL